MKRPTRSFEDFREARDKADADKRRLLDRLKGQKATVERERAAKAAVLDTKRNRFSNIGIAEALKAVQRFEFLDLEAPEQQASRHLNRPTLALLELYLRVLSERNSVSVLQWPHDQRDISSLHPLAMLAVLGGAPEKASNAFKWCSPVPDIRTLYFPWRGHGTGIVQRRTLVDRAELTKRNGLHLTRQQSGEAEHSTELAKLHLTLGHLVRLKIRDETKPHLAHPTLGEIYPTYGALGGDNAPGVFSSSVYELFGRVAHGAALAQLQDDRAVLSQPTAAPFAFFGVCPRANIKAALHHPALTKGRSPDACILDLNSPGMSRLGPGWDREVQEFLELLIATHPETPVLAVTQDAYVHRRVSYLLSKFGLSQNGAGSSRIVVRASDALFTPDPPIGEVTEARFQFHSTAGKGAAALRALSSAARDTSDPIAAGMLRHTMGIVRRTMSLPCGLKQAHDILLETEGQEAAEAFLERRSAGSVLANINRQIDLSSDGTDRARLAAAKGAIDEAFSEFENDTPVGSLLAEFAATLSRKSSQSVIAFAREENRILGERRICDESEHGQQIRKRIDSGFMRLATLRDLDNELALIESGRSRNSWKRLVVVAPPRDQFDIMLGRKWLPEEIIVLSDREFVAKLAATYQGLSSHPDLSGAGRIGSRLAAAASAAMTEAKARDVAPIELELDSQPPVITDERVIDLTGGEDDDERGVVEIALESGRSMRARPRGLVIRYDRMADVNPFQRTTARDVAVGNTIVVPNQAFVQEARTVLPVRVLAQARVAMYHAAVEAAVPGLPGSSRAAKARHVVQRLEAAGARSVGEAAVLDWLNAAEHKLVPAERLRPHAPQRWREFRAFMELAGIPGGLAETIWREGIEPLRIDRRRAGARMAQAFVSVLVDPHGGAGSLSTEVKEQVALLRRQALDHLDGVLAITTRTPSEDVHA